MDKTFEEFKESIKGTHYADMIDGFVEPSDDIEFKCIRCGNCCKNRNANGQQILISPLDIYNGSKELGITPKEFVEEYTEISTGTNSGLVVLTISCNEDGDCKLLEYDDNGLAGCRIHKSKPLICAIHPLGIVHMKERDKEEGELEKKYIVASYCDNSKNGEYTKCQEFIDSINGTDEEIDMAMRVRTDWTSNYILQDIIDDILLYNILAMPYTSEDERKDLGISDRLYNASKKVLEMFKNNVGELEEENMSAGQVVVGMLFLEHLQNINLHYSYLNYDLDKPFLEQCKENLEELKNFGNKIIEFRDMLMEDMTSKLTEEQKEKIKDFKEYYPIVIQKELLKASL